MIFHRSGIALVTVVIFVVLISLIAVASINLMAGQALLIEHQIQRIRAFYVTEAAINYNFMRLFAGFPVENPTTIDSRSVNCTQTLGSGPFVTSTIKATLVY